MTCPPFCDKCGGNLGHPANGDFTCAKCIGARSRKDNRKIRKERITKVEFHTLGGFDNAQLFRLQSRGGAWRYYRRVGPVIVTVDLASPGGDIFVKVTRRGNEILSVERLN